MHPAKHKCDTRVVVGPLTPKDGVDIKGVALQVELSKCCAPFVPRTSKEPPRYLGRGYFCVTLSGHKDTDSVGPLKVIVWSAGCESPCEENVYVFGNNVFDSIFNRVAQLKVDLFRLFGQRPAR